MPTTRNPTVLDRVTERFAGDSGDGSQLIGNQFTDESAAYGNDIATFPDFPAEIRAPAGSLPGVSGFQVSFASSRIHTPGDKPDLLVAMNPAALRVNLPDLDAGAAIIVNGDAFTEANLEKAGFLTDPLTDGSLTGFRVFVVPITSLTRTAVEGLGLNRKESERPRNFFALGLALFIYGRPLENTLAFITSKFAKRPEIATANERALRAGYHYGETTEAFAHRYRIEAASLEPGTYRNILGNQALALGLVTAGRLAHREIYYASYPITPASDILQELAPLKAFGVKTFQAEDEIASVGAAIGASFGGGIGVTGTSGPGLALKSEGIGLAVMTELPLVVIDVQRAGPSTGMPTKPEQADLLQALYGRNGESPVAVLAPATPSDCFAVAIQAVRIAIRHMTPVLVLSDMFLASSSEPWKLPDISELEEIETPPLPEGEGFEPYRRESSSLARPWVPPGTPGLLHRIGGLEKADVTGHVCYDADNHQRMVDLRAEKIARIADFLPPVEVEGDPGGDLVLLCWGSTYGAVHSAVARLRRDGHRVGEICLRSLNPFPRGLGEALRRFRRVLVPELNSGQLTQLVRARYLIDAVPFAKVTGRPFRIAEIEARAKEILGQGAEDVR